MNKTLIALSGGVDSAAAALLLQRQGHVCAGAMMRLFPGNENAENDARAVAEKLDMPFHLLDCAVEFQQRVITPFVSAYLDGITPNPCVSCNRHIKFGAFMQKAQELGYSHIATGHYARVERDGQRTLLKTGLDATKDQSYVLYTLTQQQLAHVLFPLGDLTKTQARELVSARNLVSADKKESQDICFVPDGDYAEYILSSKFRVLRRYVSPWNSELGTIELDPLRGLLGGGVGGLHLFGGRP